MSVPPWQKTHNILTNLNPQHGIRSGSTERQLLTQSTNDWYSVRFPSTEVINIAILDFPKAFDTAVFQDRPLLHCWCHKLASRLWCCQSHATPVSIASSGNAACTEVVRRTPRPRLQPHCWLRNPTRHHARPSPVRPLPQQSLKSQVHLFADVDCLICYREINNFSVIEEELPGL